MWKTLSSALFVIRRLLTDGHLPDTCRFMILQEKCVNVPRVSVSSLKIDTWTFIFKMFMKWTVDTSVNFVKKHLQMHMAWKDILIGTWLTTRGFALLIVWKLSPRCIRNSNERPFSCADCGKRLKDRKSLRRHQASHQNLHKIPCVFCGQNFSRMHSLRQHLRLHINERLYECLHCPQSFPLNNCLNKH